MNYFRAPTRIITKNTTDRGGVPGPESAEQRGKKRRCNAFVKIGNMWRGRGGWNLGKASNSLKVWGNGRSPANGRSVGG